MVTDIISQGGIREFDHEFCHHEYRSRSNVSPFKVSHPQSTGQAPFNLLDVSHMCSVGHHEKPNEPSHTWDSVTNSDSQVLSMLVE